MKSIKKLIFIVFCAIFVFSGCEPQSEEGSSGSKTENQAGQESQNGGGDDKKNQEESKPQTENQASIVSVYSESKEFSDSEWKEDVTVSAEKFSSFSVGDKIILYFSALNFSPSYSKVKIYAVDSNWNWNVLSSGTYSGGNYDDGVSINLPCALTYAVTSSDAEKLRQNGLALNGYGFILTRIEIQTAGSENSSPSSESQNENSSENGSSTENSGSETIVTPKDELSSTVGTPYEKHGKLHVSGAYLYDENNEKYQLYGMSTHGLNFGDDFSRYVNKDAFKTLRDDWNTNCIRLVLYPKDYNGYCNGGDKAKLKQTMKNGIDCATELGMYVLVDWHVHNYSPAETQSEAITFLLEISAEYKNYGNVLYEICNEPTSSPWSSVIKPYAQKVIPAIRKNAPDAIIIVGTNTWSQDIEDAAADKLDFENVMYTFHFYANTHTDSMRTRVENAISGGLPVFITEFGTCDASGNGGFNANESQKWFDLIAKYNISHLNWSLSNKGETASAILSSCSKTSDWSESDLTESGKLVRTHFRTLTK